MIHYSVLVPVRDSMAALCRLLPALCQILQDLVLPYEIICIDDASGDSAGDELEDLLLDYRALRVLRFDRPRGLSAALRAGIAASRGDLVIAIDPNCRLPIKYLPHLLARLSPADLVVGRSERSLAAQLREPFSKLGRIVTGDGRLHADEELFWVAHRQAVADLALARGAFRLLPALVARRSGRVCEVVWSDGLPPQGAPYAPGICDRLASAWVQRRFEPHLASELGPGPIASERQTSSPAASRAPFRPARLAGRNTQQPIAPSSVGPVESEGSAS